MKIHAIQPVVTVAQLLGYPRLSRQAVIVLRHAADDLYTCIFNRHAFRGFQVQYPAVNFVIWAAPPASSS